MHHASGPWEEEMTLDVQFSAQCPSGDVLVGSLMEVDCCDHLNSSTFYLTKVGLLQVQK